jgi:hypothetical protein
MSKKNFLPVNQRDVEIPLMERHNAAVAALGGLEVYKNNLIENSGLPKARKTKSWIMKMFSALTFLGLIFGGTIIGFSFKVIGINQIGYYNNEKGYMSEGVYFQFPWTKEEMHIINIGTQYMEMNNIPGVFNDGVDFTVNDAGIKYNITNIDSYVNITKQLNSPSYCIHQMKNAIRDEIQKMNKIKHIKLELNSIEISDCGILLEQVIFSKPN